MRIRLVLALLLATLPWPLGAQLVVDKAVVELSRETSRGIVRLSNDSDDTLYLRLDLFEVVDPETARPREVPLENPMTTGLLVHPRQLVLAPGQTRSARIVAQDSVVSNTDRVFRLQVSPFAGEALLDTEADRNAGVRFLVGYQILLLVRPDTLRPRLAIRRDADGISIDNAGNTNVLLRTLEICDAGGERCTRLKSNRLYAGESLPLALPPGIAAETAVVKTREFTRSTEKRVEYTP